MRTESTLKPSEIEMIPEAWEITSLEKIAEFRTGKLDSNYEEDEGQYPFFTCAPKPLRIGSFSFDCEAVLLAGNNANGIFHTHYYDGKFDAYQRTYVITQRDQRLHLKYLLYQLNYKLNYLKDVSQGTATKFLTLRILNGLEIPLPVIEEQKRIAGIISVLDAKIELNHEVNITLEAIGKAIFKHWFIDFEFPNDNGKPYRSSGGEMVFDQEMGRELPNGWKGCILADLVEVSTGKGLRREQYLEGGRYVVFGANGEIGRTDRYLYDERLILTGRVGTLGTIYLVENKCWISDNVLICKPRTEQNYHYVFFVMRQFDFLSLNRGSTQPLITQTDLKKHQVILPKVDSVIQFHNTVNDLFERIKLNTYKSNSLTLIRESLLPKLMSGKIRVPIEVV